MNDKFLTYWNPDDKQASCIIREGNEVFYGTAWCHPDDKDMANENTGTSYAIMRANIKMLQHKKNNVYRPSLKALKHLQSCMEISTHYNSKSYEAKMLQRQINYYEDMITITEKMIDDIREELKSTIDKKDEFYKKIRKARNQSDKIN